MLRLPGTPEVPVQTATMKKSKNSRDSSGDSAKNLSASDTKTSVVRQVSDGGSDTNFLSKMIRRLSTSTKRLPSPKYVWFRPNAAYWDGSWMGVSLTIVDVYSDFRYDCRQLRHSPNVVPMSDTAVRRSRALSGPETRLPSEPIVAPLASTESLGCIRKPTSVPEPVEEKCVQQAVSPSFNYVKAC